MEIPITNVNFKKENKDVIPSANAANGNKEVKETLSNSLILNLTNFKATPEQVKNGVVDLDEENFKIIKALNNFETLPSQEIIEEHANAIAMTASLIAKRQNITKVMIAGAPFFVTALSKALRSEGLEPQHAFSERVSIDSVENNTVIKKNVFKHKGFISLNPDYEISPKKKILNLTQHEATEQQKEDGVIEPENKKEIQELLTFNTLPTSDEVYKRACKLAAKVIENDCDAAMIGGASYLMEILPVIMEKYNLSPLFAFSERQVQETVKEDGSVEKTNIFVHKGFVKFENSKLKEEKIKDEIPTTNAKPIQEEIDKKREEMRKELNQMPTTGTNFSKDEGIKF